MTALSSILNRNNGTLPDELNNALKINIQASIETANESKPSTEKLQFYKIQKACHVCNKEMIASKDDSTWIRCKDHPEIGRLFETVTAERRILEFIYKAIASIGYAGINLYAVSPTSNNKIAMFEHISLIDVCSPSKGGRIVGALMRDYLRNLNLDPDLVVKTIRHSGNPKNSVFRLADGAEIMQAYSLVAKIVDLMRDGIYTNKTLFIQLYGINEAAEAIAKHVTVGENE